MVNGEAKDDTGRDGESPPPTSLKKAIVDAAIELGTEHGEEGLTMRGIAARLGVSATALYQHFEGKAAILQAIRLHGLILMNKTCAPAFELEDPIEQMRQCARLYIDFARSNPWLYSLLFQGDEIDYSAFSEEQLEIIALSNTALMKAIGRGKDSGRLRADLDVETAPFLMWAANHGLAMMLITGRLSEKHPLRSIPSMDAFIESFIDAEIRGLCPR